METPPLKLYVMRGDDSTQHLERYFSDKPDKAFENDFLKFPTENFAKSFTPGHMKGEVMIDLSVGSMVQHGMANWLNKGTGDKEKREVIVHVEKEKMKDAPPANYVTSAWLLDVKSKDQEDYRRYLRKFSQLMKPGGHLMLVGASDMTYYTVGKDKHHAFSYNEDFVRKALVGEGFVIDSCKVKKRTAVSDLTDYRAVMFIAAHKK